MSKKLIIGNWKLNPASLDEVKRIVRKMRLVAGKLNHTTVVICPPFVYLHPAISNRQPQILKIGSQSVSIEIEGAHTGEVSAIMLSDLGVKYVLAGHSEQRAKGETDRVVSQKVKVIVESGMLAVVCIGEKVRDQNGVYLDALKEQIKQSLADVPPDRAKNIILAYEPVWAIGAKEAMAPSEIYETTIFVRKVFADIFSQDQAMKVPVLYGGAVNFRNASDIIKIGQVDGLLVGRESVNLPGFVELLKVVDITE